MSRSDAGPASRGRWRRRHPALEITEGEIIFRNGQVVRAVSTEASQNLGEVLVARGVITGQQLAEALDRQRASGGRERLGDVLVEQFGIPADRIQEAIRKQAEAVVYTFFQWPRGDFSFELKEADSALDAVDADLRHMVLDAGLNGRLLEICGPEAVSMSELASMVMEENRWTGKPRRIPRPVLHLVANTAGVVKPAIRRQVRAALAVDELPTRTDHSLRHEFPELARTAVSAVVARP